MRWADGSRGTHHLAGDRDGDEDLLPRLRHVGHRQPGLAGRARRVEAGAAAYPLRHVRTRGAPGQSAQEERAHRRGRYGALPPARRRAHLRIPGADGAGLVLPLPADRPAGELRLRAWRAPVPAPIPSLLMNGASGIAVGMATNIPPHNLGEIVDGLVALIDTPELPAEDLLKIVKGPDFPTGGARPGPRGLRSSAPHAP